MKPTLLVLAAGMGSRYGSLKQMDGLGPSGEAIIDYSIYDAIRAGFGKVVFVIRHSFAEAFKEIFTPERFGGQIEVEFVYQELDYLPEGYTAYLFERGTCYGNRGTEYITHGGMTLEEAVVPFVRIGEYHG